MAEGLPDVYLRFSGLRGESMDDKHLGKDGWIQIKSFNFGFGFSDKKGTSASGVGISKAKTPEELKKELDQTKKEVDALKKKPAGKDKQGWGHSGALDFQPVKLSRSSDCMSKALMEMCHNGDLIPEVEVVACRRGSANPDEKMPFVRLVFQNVYLKRCDLKLALVGLPTEDMEFQYDVVKMESLWTNNATGNRRPEKPIRAEWDLRSQEEQDEN
ncbi:MAG: type VI secretion system tube protein Hcp [Verrucomicrobiota bacterium]